MVNAYDAPQHLGPPEGGAQGIRGRPPHQARPPGGGRGGVALNIEGRGVGGEVGRRGVGEEPGGPRGWRYLSENTSFIRSLKLSIIYLVTGRDHWCRLERLRSEPAPLLPPLFLASRQGQGSGGDWNLPDGSTPEQFYLCFCVDITNEFTKQDEHWNNVNSEKHCDEQSCVDRLILIILRFLCWLACVTSSLCHGSH